MFANGGPGDEDGDDGGVMVVVVVITMVIVIVLVTVRATVTTTWRGGLLSEVQCSTLTHPQPISRSASASAAAFGPPPLAFVSPLVASPHDVHAW